MAVRQFWQNRAHEPTLETMMLNPSAKAIDDQEKQDVLSSLPDLTNLRVVELGAGIGINKNIHTNSLLDLCLYSVWNNVKRITPYLAFKAKHVLAVDIVESFIETNRKNNQHMGNITFKACDASLMKVASDSVDLLFTNWFLIYLNDAELVDFLKKSLNWLKVDGFFHIRESCSESAIFQESNAENNSKTETNPSYYRQVCQYLTLLAAISIRDETRNVRYKFEVLWSKSINTYIEVYGLWRQIQILIKKVMVAEPVPYIGGMIKQSNFGKETIVIEDGSRLLELLQTVSIAEQRKSDESNDAKLESFSPAARFFMEAMKGLKKPQWILNVSSNDTLDVLPFQIAQGLDAHVADLECSVYAYNWKLAKAMLTQDKRIRLFWTYLREFNQNQDWSFLQRKYDAILITQPNESDDQLAAIIIEAKKSLLPEGRIFMLLGAANEQSAVEVLKKSVSKAICIKNISSDFRQELKLKIETSAENSPELLSSYKAVLESDTNWFLIEAK